MKRFLLASLVLTLLFISGISVQAAPAVAKPKAKSAAPVDPRFKKAKEFIAGSLDAQKAYAASLEYEKTEEFRNSISKLTPDNSSSYIYKNGLTDFLFYYKLEFKGLTNKYLVKGLSVRFEGQDWEAWRDIGDVEYVDPEKYK
ncbi:MAG: hypothetical protein LBQ37_04600 [Elusimicrobiota bacterium]|jgi:hypothetical protein|nr:hypothetical protein [Elusimicrobiota bacterium]